VNVVDCARMADIDRAAQQDFGIPQSLLMEDAGLGAYALLREVIWSDAPPRGEVVFLAGTGNNGGDALVMARRARLEGLEQIAIVLGAGEPKPDSLAATQLRICLALGIRVLDYAKNRPAVRRRVAQAGCLVDGLLGTGLAGAVRSPLGELIQEANSSAAQRVAVDLPSGLGDRFRPGYPALKAHWTLTIGLPKLCLYLPSARSCCGNILVVTGVFPPRLLEDPAIPGELLEPKGRAPILPALPAEAHKGQRGHLAVFAGAPGTTGAAWLAATAAARSRTGLVTLFVDRELYPSCVPGFRSVMLRPLPGAEGSPGRREAPLPELDRFDALLVGPGWGTDEARSSLLLGLLRRRLPGVLDADGITLFGRLRSGRPPRLGGRWVLTPHPGEMARLLGVEIAALLADPLPAVLSASADLQAVVALKGHCTLLAAPDGRYAVLDGMNPALGTAGSGDVLAGIVAGLLAGGLPAWEAAKAGVQLHARIGEHLFQERGYFLAEDMVEQVSAAVGRGQDDS
jgi:hydroxyethylthiazole kinase-like uncharacterized protein yjeF